MGKMEASTNLNDTINFPFKAQFYLKPIIDYWKEKPASSPKTLKKIEETVKEYPYLLKPCEDLNKWKKHKAFLNLLFKPFISESGASRSLIAVTLPFIHKEYLIATPTYKELFTATGYKLEVLSELDVAEQLNTRIIYAYKAILKKFYDMDLKVDLPVIVSVYDTNTGLGRYLKLSGNNQFANVECVGPLPQLNDRTMQKLLDQRFDPAAWAEILPPEQFLFTGVTVMSFVEVTIEEATKRIQYMLLNREESDEGSWLEKLQQEVRNLFRLPNLRLGIATLQGNGALNFTSSRPLWNSLLISEVHNYINNWQEDTIYSEILETQHTIIIEDIREKGKGVDPLCNALVDMGYLNILLTPLFLDKNMLGILELACPTTGAINGLSLFKINQIKPIFANALKRHLEEFENRVETVMLEQYTAIHPTIRWRFREAAIQILDRGSKGGKDDEIIFENLYPFYGSLDVRNSSIKRNAAVLRDLLDNLEASCELLRKGHDILSLSILDELVYEVEQRLESLRIDITKGDETELADFITKKINPVIDHLGQQYPRVKDEVRAYQEKICTDSGIFTNHRLSYDDELVKINNCIVNCLEEEELALQELVPCLFEKFKTDGVEYNIYLGNSIAPKNVFDPLHIDNLRLRQLIWTCKIMRTINDMNICATEEENNSTEDIIETKILEIAPVILAYGTPITLKFRMDEKQLDVDGSYNVRYEILKKRIDKSYIQSTEERLSQPGHVAVVYMHEEEAIAYRRHFNYLAFQGYIQPDWSVFELESLPGADGLKAIRATVNMQYTGDYH